MLSGFGLGRDHNRYSQPAYQIGKRITQYLDNMQHKSRQAETCMLYSQSEEDQELKNMIAGHFAVHVQDYNMKVDFYIKGHVPGPAKRSWPQSESHHAGQRNECTPNSTGGKALEAG